MKTEDAIRAKKYFERRLQEGARRNTTAQTINFRLALEAIEKQIPMKPVGIHTDYKCPVCGRRVRSGKGSSSRGVDHLCQRCGQQLDWSDTE